MSFFGGRKQQEEVSKPAAPRPTTPPPPSAPRQPVGFDTVLGSNTSIIGDFRGQGNARLDGVLEGTLEIDGNILIGETAKITADVHARNISIAGAVRGNVHGNKVQILRTGRVWGDIHAAAITTEEGAFIDGKITMVSHEAAVQSLEAPIMPPQEASAEPDFLEVVDAVREFEEEQGELEPPVMTPDEPIEGIIEEFVEELDEDTPDEAE